MPRHMFNSLLIPRVSIKMQMLVITPCSMKRHSKPGEWGRGIFMIMAVSDTCKHSYEFLLIYDAAAKSNEDTRDP